MKIIQNGMTDFSKKCCVALGNFDGVHCGHQRIISSCIQYASCNNLCSLIYTFESHPSSFFKRDVKLLTTNAEKLEIFKSTGCDYVYLEDFRDVAHLSPEEFCEKFIAKKLKADTVFCGENYTFGKDAEGSSELLKSILEKYGIKTIVLPHVIKNNSTVSSTLIRQCIERGNTADVPELMGRPYSVSGTVLHGKQLGRTLGFPTVNMVIPSEKITPKFGVYFTLTKIDSEFFYSISNVGTRPTVDGNTENKRYVNCETHIMNHLGNDYGKDATVYFIERIRDEKKFADVDELKSAIAKDKETAIRLSKDFDKSLVLPELRIF